MKITNVTAVCDEKEEGEKGENKFRKIESDHDGFDNLISGGKKITGTEQTDVETCAQIKNDHADISKGQEDRDDKYTSNECVDNAIVVGLGNSKVEVIPREDESTTQLTRKFGWNVQIVECHIVSVIHTMNGKICMHQIQV